MTDQQWADYKAQVDQYIPSGDICEDCGKPISHPCHGLDNNHCGESVPDGEFKVVTC